MPGQRLKQDNADAPFRLYQNDLLLAGETPRYDGRSLRIVLMRIAADGFAERAVHDIACMPKSFWHCWTLLPPERVAELTAALRAARAELDGVEIEEDPNGAYRLVECRLRGRRARLKMRYVEGVAMHNVPAFEAAWSLILAQFPDLPPVSVEA